MSALAEQGAEQSSEPTWWQFVDKLPPAQRAEVMAKLQPRLRLRYTTFTPTAKQALFLALQGREAFYGGAAGPGKSTALMMAALQYVDVPGYRALLLRKTFAELEQPGALIDMGHEMLGGTDAVWNQNRKRWTFPSGATLTFGYLEREAQKTRYQGAAYHFVGWDELTHFTESMYTYLFSRQRRPAIAPGMGMAPDGMTAAMVPIRMRSASNPGGPGHEWVKKRFVDRKTRKVHVAFVPALMTENPHLDVDSYMLALAELRGVDRQRLAFGDWDVTDGGKIFRRAEFRYWQKIGSVYILRRDDGIDERYEHSQLLRFQTWDLAVTTKTTSDFTVCSTWGMTPKRDLILIDVFRVKVQGPDHLALMHQQYARHLPSWVGVESVGFQLDAVQTAARDGLPVRELKPGGKDKVARAITAAARYEQHTIWHPPAAEWLDAWENELIAFPDSEHDDMVDTASYAASAISKNTLSDVWRTYLEEQAGDDPW